MLVEEGELEDVILFPEAEFGKGFIKELLARDRLELLGALSDPAWSSESAGYELLLVCPDDRV
jgi:hypothetical protein